MTAQLVPNKPAGYMLCAMNACIYACGISLEIVQQHETEESLNNTNVEFTGI